MYQPNPINTHDVIVPPELILLTECLAENTHEVWAEGRVKEGWSYGETRDDANKKHPCLIPFQDLPDSEKQYDRDTALETVKLILKLGYKIVKPEKIEINLGEM